MTELEKVKLQATKIMRAETNDFIMIIHEHLEGDVWEITVRSEVTGKHYTFKSEGSDFYDFQQPS